MNANRRPTNHGTIDGRAMLQYRCAQVGKRFDVPIDARGDRDRGTLEEHCGYATRTRTTEA